MKGATGCRMPPRIVGRRGRRRDPEDRPVVAQWKTDVVDNQDPNFVYHFFREDEIRDKLRPSRISLTDFETGEQMIVPIAGWQLVHRETGPEEAAGYRPDEGKPLDTLLRHGPHVCMKLPKADWAALQRKQEQRADAYEERLRGGHREDYDIDGYQSKLRPGQRAAVTLEEQPLQRI